MDLTGLISWIPVVVFMGVVLWFQRRIIRTQTGTQREVLDRQQESLGVARESVQLQRESVQLLGVIASALERR